ncbi:unnamed protein product [Schistosoma guineensis]|nr:unnamed protein product [Schistosoma guineensis]
MRTDFMCLLFAIALNSILCVTVHRNSQLNQDHERINATMEEGISDSTKHNSDFRKTETRDNTNRQSLGKTEDSHSSKNDDVGFHSSQRKFQLKYANQRRSDIYTTGYQTFLGKRRRGSKSHVKTIFRKRSGYNHNGQKKRSSTFESYGEADSFDRKKIRDVFDVNGYISEGRKRSKLGGYIQENQHAFMSGGHKSQISRNDSISLEGSGSSVSDTINQGSNTRTFKDIKRNSSSSLARRRR